MLKMEHRATFHPRGLGGIPSTEAQSDPESLEGSRKCQIKNDGSMRSSTFSGCCATRHIEITRELSERGASLEQIYGTLRSRMNGRLS
jgi:hypothetical protein